MDERIVRFIAALRNSGVRISLAETTDAFQAVEKLGVVDKHLFRISLGSTLVKEYRDQAKFDELFPLFFSSEESPNFENLDQDLTPEEIDQLLEALSKYSREKLQNLLKRLVDGRPLSEQELNQLGNQVGLDSTHDLRFREWTAQRMARALGFDALKHVLEELVAELEKLGMGTERAEQVMQLLAENQGNLMNQLRQYVGLKIAEQMSEYKKAPAQNDLMNRPFTSLSDHEIQQLRKETHRLAKALRTRIALRQKRAKSGWLDAKSTIRANLKHGSVPIELKYHDRTKKPKLVAICDISTSMRACSEFMLGLLYALQDQISKTHAFAFIDHLEYISPDFIGKDANGAVDQVLSRLPSGHYNTDLGYSLKNFFDKFLDLVDNRTTLIVVGDGRNNFNDPRIDLVKQIKRRTHKIIWLNPEPESQWIQGDSDMQSYAPLCDQVFRVSNMSELTAAVDQLLV